jgi:RecB family exonuclease
VNNALLSDAEEPAYRSAPYLSHSRVNRYLLCPEQYRLYYLENLRPKLTAAALVFGKVIHHALAQFFGHHDDPAWVFRTSWKEAGQIDLAYNARESWEKLNGCGQGLLAKFVREEAGRIANVRGSERTFELAITNLDLPFVGIIDLLADVDEVSTVVDFKTSGSTYEDHEVILSDQLTAYQLAEPHAVQTAYCVFVKTKEPKIEWHRGRRAGPQLTEFLSKVEHVGHEIAADRFYKRSGKWCSWCDYLPVCTGDAATARDTLVQIG